MIDIANYCEVVKMRNIHHTKLARCTVLIDYARFPDGYSPVRFRTENGVMYKAIEILQLNFKFFLNIPLSLVPIVRLKLATWLNKY